MGISLDNDLRIAGYRPATVRDGLRRYSRTPSPSAFLDWKSIFPLRRDAAIIFEECLDRGLIDERFSITENGETLARAKAQRRTPRDKARAVLDGLLRNAQKLNEDSEAVTQVERIWLFGSLMRDEQTVGDIDLALEMRRRPQFARDHEARRRQIQFLLSRIKDAPADWQGPWVQESWLANRALYGRRRHALLAGAREGSEDLASLGVPCRLIYDLSRGGPVDDAILPRHPASTGRDEEMLPPAQMPDLKPQPIRPMDARWVAGHSPDGRVSPYDIYRGWTDDALRLFPTYPEGLRVVCDPKTLADWNYPWTPKRLRETTLDGRKFVFLTNVLQQKGVGLILHRHIDIGSDGWSLVASVSDLEPLRRQRSTVNALPELSSAIALILAVDAERMLRRQAELGVVAPVRIHIRNPAPDDQLPAVLVDRVEALLISRVIRIEPIDWTGEKVAVRV